MIPFKFNLPLFEEVERALNRSFSAIVLSPIVDELTVLVRTGTPKEKQAARLALKLAKAKCEILPFQLTPNETVDDLILRIATERGYAVATNDKELRKRLRTQTKRAPKGIPVLYLRAGSYIAIDGFID